MKIKNKIKIKVNGKKLQINPSSSLISVLKKLDIPINKVAIEINKKIIDRKKFKYLKLNDNDSLEIVYFIGGG